MLATTSVCIAHESEAQSASAPDEPTPSIGELIRAFETVVFGTEFQSLIRK